MIKYCRDCGKQLNSRADDFNSIRCWNCYIAYRTNNKKHTYCIECNKEIFKNTKRCGNCNKKWKSQIYMGAGNPRSGVRLSQELKEKIRQSVLKNPKISKFTDRYRILYKTSSILCSKKYKSVRQIVLKRDNHTCQICGNKNLLIVHHIKEKRKYWRLFYELTNLVTLCKKCHIYIHHSRGKIKNFKTNLFKILLKNIQK